MTNSKRMAVHLLIMTMALGALTIHLVSAQDDPSTVTGITTDVTDGSSAAETVTSDTTVTVDSASSGAATQATAGGRRVALDLGTSTGALESTQDPVTRVSETSGATSKDGTSAESSSPTVGATSGTDGTTQSTVSGTATSPAVAESTSTGTTKIDLSTTTPPPTKKTEKCECTTAPTVWEAHTALFLVIIIIGACCVALTSACCICMICYGRGPMDDDTCDCFGPRQHKLHPEKEPIQMEEGGAPPHHIEVPNPIPDAEIMKDEAPMLERENPAVTPNGGGQHISKNEDDNGWVVPLDELSSAEKEKPEVENTRL